MYEEDLFCVDKVGEEGDEAKRGRALSTSLLSMKRCETNVKISWIRSTKLLYTHNNTHQTLPPPTPYNYNHHHGPCFILAVGFAASRSGSRRLVKF